MRQSSLRDIMKCEECKHCGKEFCQSPKILVDVKILDPAEEFDNCDFFERKS
jgi:hypothetical protein